MLSRSWKISWTSGVAWVTARWLCPRYGVPSTRRCAPGNRGFHNAAARMEDAILMGNSECQICDWISRFDTDEKPYFVAELETGYVVLSKWQYFKGYTFLLCKTHVSELHFLPKDFKLTFLNEMSLVSEAVYNAFKPTKMNCESLGNSASHVHWHIIPRYGTDPVPERPIWCIGREKLYSMDVVPSSPALKEMRRLLYDELKKLTVHIIRDYIADA